MQKSVFRLLQFFLSISLLAFVAWQVGLFSAAGRAEFIDMLSQASLAWLLASVVIGVVVNMSSALKWWMLCKARALHAGYWRIFSYYLVGQFYNLFLPTSVGGDVVRSYELGKHSGRQADALASVFIERYTGVLVLLVVAGFAVLSQLSVFSVGMVYLSLGFFVVVLGCVAWMIFDPRLYFWLRDALVIRIPKLQLVFHKLDRLLESVQVYGQHKRALVWAFVNSFLFYFLAVLNVYITACVFSSEVQFIDILIATPIIMLIMNIPISVGNYGLMEFGYSEVFHLLGYSPALGLSVALLMRLKSLFDGAMGGLLHPFFVTKKFTQPS